MEKKDIFDKIMSLPGLNIFEGFYKKHKEGLLYLFFGGINFFLSLFLFWLFISAFGINELISNIICWVICVLFSFVTNRIWVFNATTNDKKVFLKQIGGFYLSRLVTLFIEEAIIFIFITLMGLNSIAVKFVAQFIVIVLNYLFSKLIVFKKS